jgi:hypothetical protein
MRNILMQRSTISSFIFTINPFFFFFLVGLWFELRDSSLQSRHSTTWATHPSFKILVKSPWTRERIGMCFLPAAILSLPHLCSLDFITLRHVWVKLWSNSEVIS